MMNRFLRFLPFLFLVFLAAHPAGAQVCGLCKLSLMNSPEGRHLAKAFNHGILFLLAMPYALGGLITFGLYSIKRNENKDDQ